MKIARLSSFPVPLLLSILLLWCFARNAAAEDRSAFRDAQGQHARLTRTDGSWTTVRVLKLTPKQVTVANRRNEWNVPIATIRSLTFDRDTFEFNPETRSLESLNERRDREREERIAGERRLRSPVTVVNKTGKTVTIVLTSYRDVEGLPNELSRSRTRSSLINSLDAINDSSGKQPIVQQVAPGDTAALLDPSGRNLTTSEIAYVLETTDGKKVGKRLSPQRQAPQAAKEDQPPEAFEFVITAADIHSPVLVDIGRWTVDQDVT